MIVKAARLALFVVFATAGPGLAQSAESLRAVADAELIESGLIAWLTPRFKFKARVRLEASSETGDGDEIALLRMQEAAERYDGRAQTPVASRGETVFVAVVLNDDDEASRNARTFVSWLVSDGGKRALAGFKPAEGLAFTDPGGSTATAAAQMGQMDDDAEAAGEKLALQHCGRCHVVNEKNKYGGIGSTPSFAALRTLDDHRERFDAFWSLNPHPSFTQVEGITPPFDPARPPHIAPIELTLEEVQQITAYVARIPPKDLGNPLTAN
ncbi:MAG: c-type cytochrome [Pseudomonadota bacterium]